MVPGVAWTCQDRVLTTRERRANDLLSDVQERARQGVRRQAQTDADDRALELLGRQKQRGCFAPGWPRKTKRRRPQPHSQSGSKVGYLLSCTHTREIYPREQTNPQDRTIAALRGGLRRRQFLTSLAGLSAVAVAAGPFVLQTATSRRRQSRQPAPVACRFSRERLTRRR